jgi:hypothetical protein
MGRRKLFARINPEACTADFARNLQALTRGAILLLVSRLVKCTKIFFENFSALVGISSAKRLTFISFRKSWPYLYNYAQWLMPGRQ